MVDPLNFNWQETNQVDKEKRAIFNESFATCRENGHLKRGTRFNSVQRKEELQLDVKNFRKIKLKKTNQS